MDADAIRMLIPVMALSIPVVAIAFNGLVRIARIRASGEGGGGEELRHRLEAMEDEVRAIRDEAAALREELMDTQERLDFTERLLSRGDPPGSSKD